MERLDGLDNAIDAPDPAAPVSNTTAGRAIGQEHYLLLAGRGVLPSIQQLPPRIYPPTPVTALGVLFTAAVTGAGPFEGVPYFWGVETPRTPQAWEAEAQYWKLVRKDDVLGMISRAEGAVRITTPSDGYQLVTNRVLTWNNAPQGCSPEPEPLVGELPPSLNAALHQVLSTSIDYTASCWDSVCYCPFTVPATHYLKVLFAPMLPRAVEPYDPSRHDDTVSSGPMATPVELQRVRRRFDRGPLGHPGKYPSLTEWLNSILGGTSQDPTALPTADLAVITKIAEDNPEIPVATTTEVGFQCTRLVSPKSDCNRFAIWSPGFADYPEATQHDWEAISAGKPFRVNRQSPPHSGSWRSSHPTCMAIQNRNVEQCDEYPMAAMTQGGQANSPSLKAIPSFDNQGQGGALSGGADH